jgi:transposase-like protein
MKEVQKESGPTPHYPPEFKQEAVELYRSSEKYNTKVAKELEIADKSLRRWIKQHEVDQGERDRLSTEEREELSRLRREVRTLEQEREFLKKPGGPWRSLLSRGRDSVSRYRLIEAEKTSLPVRFMCRMLGVSASGYYDWKGRPPSKRAQQDVALSQKTSEILERSRRTRGSPRVHAELRAIGIHSSRNRVERLMRKSGLRGCVRQGKGDYAPG